jgi:hypothetical protein
MVGFSFSSVFLFFPKKLSDVVLPTEKRTGAWHPFIASDYLTGLLSLLASKKQLMFQIICITLAMLTLSPTALFAPPCLTALGLIGPRKKEKKLVLMTSARSDWT